MLTDVPTWFCQQCGEAYFEESEVESIQTAILKLDEQAEKVARTA